MNRAVDLAWTLLRLTLAVIFIGAAWYKIATPTAFGHQVNNYHLLPPWAVNPVTIVLPWVQVFCALALLSNRMTRGAALLLVLMMATFQVAVASALSRKLNVSCGCFRAGGEAATWKTFARDTMIFIACIFQLVKSWPCQAKEVAPDGTR